MPTASLKAHRAGRGLALLEKATSIVVPIESERYVLTASQARSGTVLLNGQELRLRRDDALPSLQGRPTPAGDLELAPASIVFLSVPLSRHPDCR